MEADRRSLRSIENVIDTFNSYDIKVLDEKIKYAIKDKF